MQALTNMSDRFSTRDTLQDSARLQYENNKRARRNVFAQAAAMGSEWVRNAGGLSTTSLLAITGEPTPRMRSGSGTSRTTSSDGGDMDFSGFGPGARSQSSLSLSSSPSQPSATSGSFFHGQQGHYAPQITATNSVASFTTSNSTTQNSHFNSLINPASALSPIANRVRERDMDAMEKYLRRNRSGSGTSSTDNKSYNGPGFSSAGPSAHGDDITALNRLPLGSNTTPRRLRPSMSAAQLRTTNESSAAVGTQELRSRSGTNPSTSRPTLSPPPLLIRTTSASNSALVEQSSDQVHNEPESYTGPPSQYAKFPDPPPTAPETTAPPTSRRKAFLLLSKPLPPHDSSSANHRRGMSATSVRGA